METTKKQQTTGLIFGAISLVLPNISSIITNAMGDDFSGAVGALVAVVIISIAALVCGIIGIIKSAGARKAATEAGEKKVLGTVGLVLSIVGTVYGAIILLVGLCAGCVVCAAASSLA